MRYLSITLVIFVANLCGAENPPMKHYRMETVLPSTPVPIQSSATNRLSSTGILAPSHQLKRATITPQAIVLQPSPYISSAQIKTQRAELKIQMPLRSAVQQMQAQQIQSGIIRRRPDPKPTLSLLMAITAFNKFFKDTDYRDDHYVNNVRYRYESQYKEWVYDFYVTPTIRHEVESTKPGYQEFLTTSYQVNMKGEVFVVDTPSWIEIRNN